RSVNPAASADQFGAAAVPPSAPPQLVQPPQQGDALDSRADGPPLGPYVQEDQKSGGRAQTPQRQGRGRRGTHRGAHGVGARVARNAPGPQIVRRVGRQRAPKRQRVQPGLPVRRDASQRRRQQRRSLHRPARPQIQQIDGVGRQSDDQRSQKEARGAVPEHGGGAQPRDAAEGGLEPSGGQSAPQQQPHVSPQ